MLGRVSFLEIAHDEDCPGRYEDGRGCCCNPVITEHEDVQRFLQGEATIPREVVADGCLLCSEDKPHHCRRRVVAEYFKQHCDDVEIAHLG